VKTKIGREKLKGKFEKKNGKENWKRKLES
jgi:hypothetical protein